MSSTEDLDLPALSFAEALARQRSRIMKEIDAATSRLVQCRDDVLRLEGRIDEAKKYLVDIDKAIEALNGP